MMMTALLLKNSRIWKIPPKQRGRNVDADVHIHVIPVGVSLAPKLKLSEYDELKPVAEGA